MRKTVYQNLPKLKVELNVAKVIVATIIVLCFYVLPIYLINKSQETPIAGPEVAGVSVSKVNELNLGFTRVDLNSQAGIFVTGGVILMGISIILIIFLILDDIKFRRIRNRKKHY